jgi:hypothetical protein
MDGFTGLGQEDKRGNKEEWKMDQDTEVIN